MQAQVTTRSRAMAQAKETQRINPTDENGYFTSTYTVLLSHGRQTELRHFIRTAESGNVTVEESKRARQVIQPWYDLESDLKRIEVEENRTANSSRSLISLTLLSNDHGETAVRISSAAAKEGFANPQIEARDKALEIAGMVLTSAQNRGFEPVLLESKDSMKELARKEYPILW